MGPQSQVTAAREVAPGAGRICFLCRCHLEEKFTGKQLWFVSEHMARPGVAEISPSVLNEPAAASAAASLALPIAWPAPLPPWHSVHRQRQCSFFSPAVRVQGVGRTKSTANTSDSRISGRHCGPHRGDGPHRKLTKWSALVGIADKPHEIQTALMQQV